MTEETKIKQVSHTLPTGEFIYHDGTYDHSGCPDISKCEEAVCEEKKTVDIHPIKTIKKPNVFRSVQYGQHFFWIHNGQAGVCCSRKIDGIKELQKQFPGDYTVEDIMPYTPRKYSDKIPTEISKK